MIRISHKRKYEELIEITLENRAYQDENILNSIVDLALKENSKSARAYLKKNLNKDSFRFQKMKLQNLDKKSLSKTAREFLREIKI